MKPLRLLVIVILLAGSHAEAQSAARRDKDHDSVPLVELQVSSTSALTDIPATGLMGGTSCDADGNILLRSATPVSRSASTLSMPVLKLLRSGRAVQFVADSVEGLPVDAALFQYGTGSNGHLFELLQSTEGKHSWIYLVEFTGEGHFVSKAKFADANWIPQLFQPLSSGDFLIAGAQMEHGRPGRKFAGIYGADASMKRTFRLPPEDNAEGVLWQTKDAYLSTDGNVYIFRRSSPAKVLVLNESGTLLQTLTLVAPLPNAKAMEFFISDRMILVSFQADNPKDVPHPVQYALYDRQDGTLLRSYYLSTKDGFIACLTGDEVTLLTTRNGYLALATAQVK